jgi:hypothetical protein
LIINIESKNRKAHLQNGHLEKSIVWNDRANPAGSKPAQRANRAKSTMTQCAEFFALPFLGKSAQMAQNRRMGMAMPIDAAANCAEAAFASSGAP